MSRDSKLVIPNENKISVVWFGSGFVGRNASGTAQTARKIVEYLIQVEFQRIQVVLILKSELEANLIKNDKILSKASIIILPNARGKFLKSSRQFYKFIFKNKNIKFDIVHFSVARLYPFFWKFPAKKFFCTFHAGGEITVPQDKFVLSRHIYNLIVKLTWKKIDRIFADSEFGINEIELNYRIPRARIDLIHLGSDHLWNLKPKSINLDKSKINIAVIGRWQKYKNVHSILRAFVNLDSNLMSNFNIFLVGKSNMSGKGLVLKSLNKIDKKCVTTFDYLTDNELKFIYQNVNLVIHPSINEGFGLPAFEAFGEGCPVAIHSETPAGFYLSNQNMVFAINMLDLYEITKLFLNSSKFKRVSVKQRRKYLLNNIMTWDQICSQYVEFYLDAFKYDVIKCFLRHD